MLDRIRLSGLALWRRPVVIFGFIHAAIFMFLFVNLASNYRVRGILELDFAMKIIEGKMPYVDFPFAFPPLALVSFLLPALVFQTPMAYTRAFAVEMLLLDLLALGLITAFATRFKLGVWKTVAVYTLLVVAVGPILVCRYDLLPAVLVLATVCAFAAGRNKSSWALLALGVAAKLYPVVIAPLFILYYLRRRRYREMITGMLIFLGVLLLVILPWLVIDARSLLLSFGPHAQRGLHSESSYGSILLVSALLRMTQVTASLSVKGGSWDLSSTLADQLAATSPYISAALLLIVYALYARLQWRRRDQGIDTSTLLMANYSLLAILVFLVGNKVFSPQYLVWLCPLLPLLVGRWHHSLWLWLLFTTIGGITQYIYPYHYIEFETGKPYLVVMLFLRNLLLIAMTALLAFVSESITGRESWPTTQTRLKANHPPQV